MDRAHIIDKGPEIAACLCYLGDSRDIPRPGVPEDALDDL